MNNFRIQNLVGSGAYGHVWRAIDKKSGRHVAIKKIFDAFHNEIDSQRTYREINFMYEL